MATELDASVVEVKISDILNDIWKVKYYIIAFVIAVSLATVFIVIRMDNIYESKALLKTTQNNSSNMSSLVSSFGGLASLAGVDVENGAVSGFSMISAILNDDEFIADFVINNKFEQYVVSEYEEKSKDQKFKDNKSYYINEALRENLRCEQDKKSNIIVIAYQNKNREFSKLFLDRLLVELSKRYQELDIYNIQQKIDNYKSEIDKTNDITIKNKLAEIVSGLIQSKILSQAQQYYAFDIIVKPQIPSFLDKVKPRRAVICILVFMMAAASAAATAVVVGEYKRRVS